MAVEMKTILIIAICLLCSCVVMTRQQYNRDLLIAEVKGVNREMMATVKIWAKYDSLIANCEEIR